MSRSARAAVGAVVTAGVVLAGVGSTSTEGGAAPTCFGEAADVVMTPGQRYRGPADAEVIFCEHVTNVP